MELRGLIRMPGGLCRSHHRPAGDGSADPQHGMMRARCGKMLSVNAGIFVLPAFAVAWHPREGRHIPCLSGIARIRPIRLWSPAAHTKSGPFGQREWIKEIETA
jgi:hypothetical protein